MAIWQVGVRRPCTLHVAEMVCCLEQLKKAGHLLCEHAIRAVGTANRQDHDCIVALGCQPGLNLVLSKAVMQATAVSALRVGQAKLEPSALSPP